MFRTATSPQPPSIESILPLPDLHRLKTLSFPLIVIAESGSPVGETALASLCQVDRGTARRWLSELTRQGYLERERSHLGYFLTSRAVATIGGFCTRFGEKYTISTPTTTTSINRYQNINREKSVVEDSVNGENCTISGEVLTIPPQIIAALRACGIGEPKRSVLARLPFMTLEYIESWKSNLRERRKLAPGLLIHCLETGDPPPGAQPETKPDFLSVFDHVLQDPGSSSILIDASRFYR